MAKTSPIELHERIAAAYGRGEGGSTTLADC